MSTKEGLCSTDVSALPDWSENKVSIPYSQSGGGDDRVSWKSLDARIQHRWRTEGDNDSPIPDALARSVLPVWELGLEIFKKLVVEDNLKVVTSHMHFTPLVILFAFIGGDTVIECYLSNIYVKKLGTGM